MSTATFGDFEWDTDKAASNVLKHGVSFPEAMTVFGDDNVIIEGDGNGNLLATGYSESLRILVVVHVERGDLVRIISARPATRAEARRYHE